MEFIDPTYTGMYSWVCLGALAYMGNFTCATQYWNRSRLLYDLKSNA